MWADQALERFLEYSDVRSVLDVGAGAGEHAQRMRDAGMVVVETDWVHGVDYNQTPMGVFDGIWCSHVLEHQLNVNHFLRKVYSELRPDGVLAITVPPMKHDIVGGHVTVWNAGLLAYNLILAGFDLSQARVGEYGYNISIIIRRKAAALPRLHYDAGDIELLAPFWPWPVQQGFRGHGRSVRW